MLSEVTNSIHSSSYTLSSPSSQRLMWKTNSYWKCRSICTSVPPGKAQLKPLSYKTHSASHGPGIIKIHYFLHSECHNHYKISVRGLPQGMCPLFSHFFPQIFLFQPHNLVPGPCPCCVQWSCKFLRQRKFTLTVNFWAGGIKEKLISFLNAAKTIPHFSLYCRWRQRKSMALVVPGAAWPVVTR